MTFDEELASARTAILRNRALIEASTECGCVNCLTIYEANENFDWIDKDQPTDRWTALCQLCDEPFVIGDAAGFDFGDDGAVLNRLYDPLIRTRLTNAPNH